MHRDMLVHNETNAYLHVSKTWEKVLEVGVCLLGSLAVTASSSLFHVGCRPRYRLWRSRQHLIHPYIQEALRSTLPTSRSVVGLMSSRYERSENDISHPTTWCMGALGLWCVRSIVRKARSGSSCPPWLAEDSPTLPMIPSLLCPALPCPWVGESVVAHRPRQMARSVGRPRLQETCHANLALVSLTRHPDGWQG